MSFETRALPLWPETRLPKDGVLFFYDPTSDGEYRFLPEQLGDAGPGVLADRHTFRFRTRAEANADGNGGEVLEEFDYSKLYTYAEGLVEFWRDNTADLNEVPRGQPLVAAFDKDADKDHQGWRTSGGEAGNAGRIGLKFVFPEDPAATGVVEYNAQKAVPKGQPRYYDDGQGVQFYEAVKNLTAPVPAPVRGQTTAYWMPINKPPVPGSVDYSTLLGRVKTSQQAQADVAASKLKAGTDLVTGLWNGANGGVILTPITKSVYGSIGYIYVGGKPIAVEADLATLTYKALGSGGSGGTTRDPNNLSTAKVLQVIADYQAAGGPFVETDESYYEGSFIDDETDPGNVWWYICKIFRPAKTGGATVWKWCRFLEAGA